MRMTLLGSLRALHLKRLWSSLTKVSSETLRRSMMMIVVVVVFYLLKVKKSF